MNVNLTNTSLDSDRPDCTAAESALGVSLSRTPTVLKATRQDKNPTGSREFRGHKPTLAELVKSQM